jgi:N-acetylglucosamine malate deacetylase 1
MMGGTLCLLGRQGCELHYMNVANGSCGTKVHDREAIIRIRREEARKAAALAGAKFHDSLVDDLDVFYTPDLVARMAAKVREVAPRLILAPSLEDYMEDHMNSARVVVTAAFVRGMRNYVTNPMREPFLEDLVVYHAMPFGLKDMMSRPMVPDFTVDVASVMERKTAMLACHESQQDWLDRSQGLSSYLQTMQEMTREMGRISGRFRYAEGWRRHNPLGFASAEADPLREILDGLVST